MQTHAHLNKLRNSVAQASRLPATLPDRLRQLADEADRLESEGLHLIGAGIRAGRPCIELAVHPRLANLAQRGEAAYYGHGQDDLGRWRRGTLLRRAVTVFWTERGN